MTSICLSADIQDGVSYSRLNFDNNTNLIMVNPNRQINSSKPINLLNQWNKTSGFYFYPLTNELSATVECNPCSAAPKFVRDMNPHLFRQIQGVVPFNQSEESYLILFKIKDRLKYCLTEGSEVWRNFDFGFN